MEKKEEEEKTKRTALGGGCELTKEEEKKKKKKEKIHQLKGGANRSWVAEVSNAYPFRLVVEDFKLSAIRVQYWLKQSLFPFASVLPFSLV